MVMLNDDPNIDPGSPQSEPSTRSVTRLMNLALMTFHRAPSGVVHVENPGGKVMALFQPYLRAGKEEWRVIDVPSGLSAEEAQLLFVDWRRDDGRCD